MGYKGVSWDKENKKYVAQICVNGAQTKIGRYSNLEDAARAYDKRAREIFREFAKVNFPEE